nr:zinc-ribbon domain-containing protein [Arthrobacter sp. efr-133-TYG-118]
MRPGDIGWGCSCRRNGKSASTPSPSKGKHKDLLCESENEALRWWDHDANDEIDFNTLTVRARRVCHWVCPECGHKFPAAVYEMTSFPDCPQCRQRRHEEYERYEKTPVSDLPELLAAWDDEDEATTVMVASGDLRRFACPEGHHPRVTPLTYLRSGCPSCRRNATRQKGGQTLRQMLPEIASQWHPTKNGPRWTPDNVGPDSKRKVWWRADCCEYEWEDPVRDRDKYLRLRCPRCETILGSLAWVDPGLAAEWSPENPLSAWHFRPTASTSFTPKWVCSVNPEHLWEAPLSSRYAGAECPECRETGKSKVELEHLAECKKVFTRVRSGASLRDPAFATRKTWTVDILAKYGDRKIAIEYDGFYWHSPLGKAEVDRRKSVDLLAAGYTVVRLREDELASLGIDDENYLEIRVYSRAPRPAHTVIQVLAWLEGAEDQEANEESTARRKPSARAYAAEGEGFTTRNLPVHQCE